MSKPELKIVVALLEGYISQRYESDWKLKETEDQKTTLPTNEKVQKKIDSLVHLLHALPSAESKKRGNQKEREAARRWIHFLKVLHEEELVQSKVGYWKDFLAQTMKAVRSYILEALNDNAHFIKMKAELAAKIESAQTPDDKANAQKALDALNFEPGFLKTYFDKNMVGYDAKTIALKETTLEDFKANALDETKRPTTYVSRLLRTYPKPANTVAPVVVADDAANDNNVTATHTAPAVDTEPHNNNAPAKQEQQTASATQEEVLHRKLARKLAMIQAQNGRLPVGHHAKLFKSNAPVSKQAVDNMSRELRKLQGPK